MKRLPLIVSILIVVALSSSLAYWGVELSKKPQRPIATPVAQVETEAPVDGAASMFGGQAVQVAVSNYQLKGVVASGGNGSVAILAIDGKPPRALPVGAEVAAGITVKEVQPRFVLLSEGGVIKRIELAADPTRAPDAGGGQSPGLAMPQPAPQPIQVAPAAPASIQQDNQGQGQGQAMGRPHPQAPSPAQAQSQAQSQAQAPASAQPTQPTAAQPIRMGGSPVTAVRMQGPSANPSPPPQQ
ncbi:MAG: type II secretion system protein N [Pseudomonadota bacterium]